MALPAFNPSLSSDLTPDERIGTTFRLMKLAGLWRTALDRALRPHGMSIATMRPLAYLTMMPDGVSQRALASAMNTDGSTLVRVLDMLEKSGWVERRQEPDNRRKNRLYLTQAGRLKGQAFEAVAADVEAALMGELAHEKADFNALCDQVLAGAERLVSL